MGGEEGGELYYHSAGVQIQIPHVVSADTRVGWDALQLDGDGLPKPSLSLL